MVSPRLGRPALQRLGPPAEDDDDGRGLLPGRVPKDSGRPGAPEVFEDLGEDAILLCWEAPGKFCRGRLVAAWLEEKLGVQVPELPQGYYHNQRNLFV